MGHRLRLSGPANEDIRSIWEYTRSTYDYEQAIAYFELLEQAIRDVVADPERPSSIPRPELGTGVRSYHIALSKFRSGTGIKSPRHVIVYALRRADEVYILRIVHDRMNLRRQPLE